MNTVKIISLFILIGLFSCKKDDNNNNNPGTNITYGKNRVVTVVDGTSREYYTHIPKKYNANTKVPVVFMLHGTSGEGLDFYENSGWKEVGETDNIITVFPSSMRYCIFVPGEGTKTTTKWNTPPDCEWSYCPNAVPQDDIKFFRTIISELEAKYNIDSKRIYLVGFSNGGQMAAKCTIELSDKLAAVVESAGTFFIDTTYTPKRKLPVLFQKGNDDYGPGGSGPSLPLSKLDKYITEDTIYTWHKAARTHVKYFNLDPTFTISGDTNSISIADFKGINDSNVFRMAMIKGLKHAYPNGTNHPLEAAKVNWAWLKQYTLP